MPLLRFLRFLFLLALPALWLQAQAQTPRRPAPSATKIPAAKPPAAGTPIKGTPVLLLPGTGEVLRVAARSMDPLL